MQAADANCQRANDLFLLCLVEGIADILPNRDHLLLLQPSSYKLHGYVSSVIHLSIICNRLATHSIIQRSLQEMHQLTKALNLSVEIATRRKVVKLSINGLICKSDWNNHGCVVKHIEHTRVSVVD